MNYQLLGKMAKYKIDSSLQKETKAYMKDVLEHLTNVGVIENVDTAALSMLAKNYDTFILCNQQLSKEGLTVTSDRGNISEHPLVKVRKDAITQAIKIMVEFGLTAKSRSKLPTNDKDTELSPLEQFVIKGREYR